MNDLGWVPKTGIIKGDFYGKGKSLILAGKYILP